MGSSCGSNNDEKKNEIKVETTTSKLEVEKPKIQFSMPTIQTTAVIGESKNPSKMSVSTAAPSQTSGQQTFNNSGRDPSVIGNQESKTKPSEESNHPAILQLEAKINLMNTKVDEKAAIIKDMENKVKALLIAQKKSQASDMLKKLKVQKDIQANQLKRLGFYTQQLSNYEHGKFDEDMLGHMKVANSRMTIDVQAQEQLAIELEKANEIAGVRIQNKEEINGIIEDDDEDDLMEELDKMEQDMLAEEKAQKQYQEILAPREPARKEQPKQAVKKDLDDLQRQAMLL